MNHVIHVIFLSYRQARESGKAHLNGAMMCCFSEKGFRTYAQDRCVCSTAAKTLMVITLFFCWKNANDDVELKALSVEGGLNVLSSVVVHSCYSLTFNRLLQWQAFRSR